MVKNILWVIWEWFFLVILWCAHVIVTPDVKRIAVFNKGTWKGLKIKIPNGGQILPSSIVGESLLWKKAQKNLIKKNFRNNKKNYTPT